MAGRGRCAVPGVLSPLPSLVPSGAGAVLRHRRGRMKLAGGPGVASGPSPQPSPGHPAPGSPAKVIARSLSAKGTGR